MGGGTVLAICAIVSSEMTPGPLGMAETSPMAEAPQPIANAASADAYLAEMTLKYVGSAAERKSMTEKTRDRDVAALVAKLDANEKAILLANRAKNEAQASAEKLYIENRNLNNELRTAYDGARKKEDSSRDRDREKEHHDKEREKKHEERPKDDDGGGGVLGR